MVSEEDTHAVTTRPAGSPAIENTTTSPETAPERVAVLSSVALAASVDAVMARRP